MLKIISIIVTFLFLILGLVLGVLNPQPVQMDLIFLQTELPLSLLLAGSIVGGMIIAALYFSSVLVKEKWDHKKLQKEKERLTNEVVQLKKQIVDMETLQAAQQVEPAMPDSTDEHLPLSGSKSASSLSFFSKKTP